MSPVRYAIVGFGGIAENRLAKEGFALDAARFEPMSDIQLVAATDPNPARRPAAEALGLEWRDSLEETLAIPDLDAVVVASNNRSHASIAKTALDAGKHCFVEKPVATSPDEAEELNALAKAKGLSLAVDHMMVHNGFNKKAAELITDGAIGDVNDLCLHMEFQYGSTPEEAASWRCSVPEELGGPIGDAGSHCFYMAEFLLKSEIATVQCAYYPKVLDIAVENGAFIKFTMKNGETGSIRVAFCEPRGGALGTMSNLGFEAYGSEGVLRSYATLFQLSGHPDEPVRQRLVLENADATTEIKPDHVDNIYQSIIRSHAESVRANTPLTGDEAERNIRIIAAAHQSARQAGAPAAVG